ncbi:hypothetical protein AURDEDRAFT_59961 [Auricularia subglabra TFB-10046 SS5]|nr:hypothetical protein AURDEDRAFT_59961 [Auricularia subglabra TFB-10046 SS5]
MSGPAGSSSLKRKAPDDRGRGGQRTVHRRFTPPPPQQFPLDATVLGLPDVHASLTDPPIYGQPYQLASFSYSPERELVFDDSALRYYIDPPRRADLTYRYDHWNRRAEERGRLDGLLRACALPDVVGERGRANVITWRGVMTKIMSAPYEDRDGWELAVMCVNDQLYIEEQFTAERLAQMDDDDPRRRLMTYFGYSFESYCTTEKPPHETTASEREERTYNGGWGGDVNTNVQWCSVVKTKIGPLRLICGGEVDCEIVVGFRTHAGELAALERYDTLRLGNEVQDPRNKWNHDVCLQWALDLLKWVHKQVRTVAREEKTPVPVWKLKFLPRQGVSIARMSEAEVEYVRGGEDRVGFLPTWFYEHLTGVGTGKDAEAETGIGSTKRAGP